MNWTILSVICETSRTCTLYSFSVTSSTCIVVELFIALDFTIDKHSVTGSTPDDLKVKVRSGGDTIGETVIAETLII